MSDADKKIAEFIRRRGVTRCPTAAVAATTAAIAESDRAVLASRPLPVASWNGPRRVRAASSRPAAPGRAGKQRAPVAPAVPVPATIPAPVIAPTAGLPELAWVPVGRLGIGGGYQRDASRKASKALINRIAANWSWNAYQPLTVATAEASEAGYHIIDGQHRWMAARKKGLGTLPCYVVPAMSVAEQARSFVAINRDRRALMPTQLHRAALAARDPEAQRIELACRAAGVTIAATGRSDGLPPGQTLAVRKIGRLIKDHGDGLVVRSLKLLVEAAGERRDQLRAEMIAATALILKQAALHRLPRERVLAAIRRKPAQGWLYDGRERQRSLGGNTMDAIAALVLDEAMQAGRKKS